MSEQTKGEALINGIDKIKEGLEMISGIGGRQDIVKMLVGSTVAANRLKDLVRSNDVFERMVLQMVSARNPRLSAGTVENIITDFLDVLFDLSRPYKTAPAKLPEQPTVPPMPPVAPPKKEDLGK